MAAEKTEQVMIRLTPDLLETLRTVSQDQERTVAQTIRLAIKEYLSNTLAPTA
jgi:hypothetical protein